VDMTDIFRPDRAFDVVVRTVATWELLPLMVILSGFFAVSSWGALAWAHGWMKPRTPLVVMVFGAESVFTTLLFGFLGGVFAIHSYGLAPRSSMSLCELNSIRIRLITGALDNFYRAQNTFPTSADWSADLKTAGIWPAESIPTGDLLDAGGESFQLETDGFSAALRSSGGDRRFGTSDDYLCEKLIDETSGLLASSWTCSPDGLTTTMRVCAW